MDQDRFRNISNLDLVEPNQIMDLVCIRLVCFTSIAVYLPVELVAASLYSKLSTLYYVVHF